ncbi:MAG: WecB/TagA/CpsF family glycosyltransferase [Brevundimonas sp.]|nr:MAG: WecB/TagA/CpsF family glycosyltransferase [Brevundimonas sp.]
MYHDRTGMTAALAIPDRRKRSRKPIRSGRRPGTRIQLLDQSLDLVRPEEVMAEVEGWIEDGQKAVVANHNLHSMELVRSDPIMQAFYSQADLIQVDSKPLIWLARACGYSASGMHRSTYLDWRNHFWSLANRRGWRVFYVGGADGVAATAAASLAERYPRAVIGTHSGYFDATPGSTSNDDVLDQIRDFAPNIILVGMGMPRQEAWIVQNLADLPDAVIFNVGAAFDYEAGVQKAAPRWMGKSGLEWLYRLVNDPGRLFHRYCVEPWRLAGPIWRDLHRSRDA